jgi:daunosaminyl-N,N-dimethyltransferase/N-dimethyltransferase
MTTDRKLFGEHAELYDLIYTKLDYDKNAARVADLLAAEGVADGARVLEAASGTGAYTARLAKRFRMSCLDISAELIAVSRKKNPDVPHVVADMAGFSLSDFDADQPFDALVCLFGSVGYLLTPDRVHAAMRCFAHAVRPGGAVIVEPWLAPETFNPGFSWLDTYQDDDVKLARASYSSVREEPQGKISVLDFEWVVTRTDVGLSTFSERHELWLCPREVMADALREAGLEARFEEDGLLPRRGIWIARKEA